MIESCSLIWDGGTEDLEVGNRNAEVGKMSSE